MWHDEFNLILSGKNMQTRNSVLHRSSGVKFIALDGNEIFYKDPISVPQKNDIIRIDNKRYFVHQREYDLDTKSGTITLNIFLGDDSYL